MKKQVLKTSMGNIAIYCREVKDTVPIILLHGVYFDHHLLSYQASRINNRTIITIDMPLHGGSINNVPDNWNLADCGEMLLEIINELHFQKVIAIGHSWGSMAILRAAYKYPERFQSVGFCNMPFEKTTGKMKWVFHIMHLLLPFRTFYTKQMAKAFYGKQTLKEKPELFEYFDLSMAKLSNLTVRKIDSNVIISADDATDKIASLQIPALALKGKEDYVPVPRLPTKIVDGGHFSPLEVPEEVFEFIIKVTTLKQNDTPQVCAIR